MLSLVPALLKLFKDVLYGQDNTSKKEQSGTATAYNQKYYLELLSSASLLLPDNI